MPKETEKLLRERKECVSVVTGKLRRARAMRNREWSTVVHPANRSSELRKCPLG